MQFGGFVHNINKYLFPKLKQIQVWRQVYWRWLYKTVLDKPTFAYTADLHGAVPLSILTCQVGIVSTESKAVITDELNYSAVGKQSTWGRVAGVSPILRFGERQTCWWRKKYITQVSNPGFNQFYHFRNEKKKMRERVSYHHSVCTEEVQRTTVLLWCKWGCWVHLANNRGHSCTAELYPQGTSPCWCLWGLPSCSGPCMASHILGKEAHRGGIGNHWNCSRTLKNNYTKNWIWIKLHFVSYLNPAQWALEPVPAATRTV